MRTKIRKKHDVRSEIDFITIVGKKKCSDLCGTHVSVTVDSLSDET